MKRTIIYIILLFLGTQYQALAQEYGVQCEDTCTHVHGIDMSHYQGKGRQLSFLSSKSQSDIAIRKFQNSVFAR